MIQKRDIRAAAYKLFAAKGFNETTTENIASALGLKKQSLYTHYKSKQELIREVLHEQSGFISRELLAALEILKAAPFEAVLQDIFKKFITIFSDEERIKFWKRVYIADNDEFEKFLHDVDHHFDIRLYNALQKIFNEQYPAKKNTEVFRMLYYPLMAIFHGYLDAYSINLRIYGWDNLWGIYRSGVNDTLSQL